MSVVGRALLLCLMLAPVPALAQPLTIVSVPFLSQSEQLCGGAAAAMVLRFWGAQGLSAEAFAGLVDGSAGGIRTAALTGDLRSRGWNAVEMTGSEAALARESAQGRPSIVLIEDRPGTYHYVVVVGWHARGVVLHDPARAPYRVMAAAEFMRRWDATGRWMLVVTPGSPREVAPGTVADRPAEALVPPPSSACDELIARGVREAQAGTLDAAEATLVGALGCSGAAAYRELAGVRALQRRWPEAAELAQEALAQEASDSYAWQLLATARFVTNDEQGALAAWNAIGQPRLDLFVVDGLERTRQGVVERLGGFKAGALLTVDGLRRMQRQMADWPAMTRARVGYVPKPNGLADVRVTIAERPRVPRSPLLLSMIGARAAFSREVRVTLGPMTGGGDRTELGWRFWHDRPRVSAGILAPAPWGGLWGVQVSAERQPFTSLLAPLERQSAGTTLSAWSRGWLRWQAGGGVDRWLSRGRFGTLHGGLDAATRGDGVVFRVRGQTWRGEGRGFGSVEVQARTRWTSTSGRLGLQAQAVLAQVSRSAPYDLWPAGDTGLVRGTLLRAHPLVRDGEFRTSRLGARVGVVSVEVQRWWRRAGAQFGPAVFADTGRTARRVDGRALNDVDAGVGLRARFPGMPGMVRVDAARGWRDGAGAISFVYDAAF